MKLKSFGCSFIFGNELSDDGYGQAKATPSQLTWPALLAKDLGYQYECWAKPGSGNLQILSRLLDSLAAPEPSLYVVGWTWIDRFDYCAARNNQWQTLTPMDETEEAKFYYQQLHSEYRDKINTLITIKSAIDALKQSGHRSIMTYMDDLIYDTRWNISPGMRSLQDQVRPYLKDFEGKNFLDWSFDQGYPIGPRGKHPLEEAHQAAFSLIKRDLDSWVSA